MLLNMVDSQSGKMDKKGTVIIKSRKVEINGPQQYGIWNEKAHSKWLKTLLPFIVTLGNDQVNAKIDLKINEGAT